MLREREAQMNDWMIGYVEGKRQALEDAAQHFEQNIMGRFNPQQVAVICGPWLTLTRRYRQTL